MSAPTLSPPPPSGSTQLDGWLGLLRNTIAGITGGGGTAPASVIFPFFDVRQYGAKGNGTTDDTNALMVLAGDVRAAGGGTIWFPPGKNYRVWASATGTLFSLNGANGVNVIGNGSTITSAQVNTATPCYVFDIHGVNGFSVDGLNFVGGNTTLTATTGETFVIGYNGSHNARFTNITVKNALRGLDCDSVATSVSRGWTILGFYCEKTYYPFGCYWLDDVLARGFVTRNCGRSYFPVAPCKNHDIALDSQQGGPFSDCLIKVYAKNTASAEDNTIANIKLNYRSSGRYASSGNSNNDEALVAFDFQQYDTNSAAANFRDIQINLDVDCNGSDKFSNLLILRKYKSDGTGDTTTTRGHTLKKLTVSGVATNCANLVQDGVRLFSVAAATTTPNWTGDTLENIALRDLRLSGNPGSGNSVYLNGQGAPSSKQFAVIDNVTADGALTQANVSSANVAMRASVFSNLNAWDNQTTTFTPTWTSSGTQPTIGNGSITGRYKRDGDMVDVTVYIQPGSTTTFGTGGYSIGGLPFSSASDGIGSSGVVFGFESGVAHHGGLVTIGASSSTLTVVLDPPSGGGWAATSPWTFKNGDYIRITLRYRAG